MPVETTEAPLSQTVAGEPNTADGPKSVLPLRVLFATDGSEPAAAAESLLALFPLPAGSAVHVLTVLDAAEWQVPESLKGAEREWARKIELAAESTLAGSGATITHSTPRGEPAVEIIHAADTFKADLIVLGTRGRTGLQRMLLGSVAENVAKHATRPVLIVRTPVRGLRRILLAVDGSSHADHAVRVAADLPLPAGAEIVVCNVYRPYYPPIGQEYVPDLDELILTVRQQQQHEAQQLVASARAAFQERGIPVGTVVEEGDPATEILELAASQSADLVIAGARGMSAIRALVVGSVADRLLKNAHCSVLLVH